MKRRSLLAAIAAGAAGLAGCSGAATGPAEPTTSPPGTPLPLARHGTPSDICGQGLVDVGIDAIDEPAFAGDWSEVTVPRRYSAGGRLSGDETVIGLEQDGAARAYPLSVLWHHEIVNDTFGGPVIVTYCPLCQSGMVASRVVDGAATNFAVSGQLWVPPGLRTRISEEGDRVFAVTRRNAFPGGVRNTSNLVMYDQATGSYWSQMLARGICGPKAGARLEIRPSTATTWADWRDRHPDTEVLLPPPESKAMEFPG